MKFSEEQETAIQNVWTEVLERWGDDRYSLNQCHRILSDWHPIILQRAKDAAEKFSTDIEGFFEHECSVAEELLTDLKFALLSHVTDEWLEENRGTLWWVQSHHNINTQPDNWTHVSPVRESYLKQATASYLEKPWLQHNFIDWAIINASLFNQVAELGDGLKSGQLLGRINWAYLIAGNKLEKRLLWEGGLALLGFLVRWIIPPAAVFALLVFNYETTAAILGGLWAVYVLLRIVGLIFGWGERRAQRTLAKSLTQKVSFFLKQLSAASA